MRSLLRNRKGITMTEVVIAMAVVIIVTGAAISLVASSVQFDAKYEKETYALNACESAVCCVRFADNNADVDLVECLQKLGFQPAPDVTDVYIYGDSIVKVDMSGSKVLVFFHDEKVYETN